MWEIFSKESWGSEMGVRESRLSQQAIAPHSILIADDDPAIVELLRDFLEVAGFQVATAHNGQEALACLAQRRVDCLLLDVMMPDLSGFELCRRIRESHNLPILFLSARDGDYDKIRGLGLGGDDYIVKSATPGEIVARIHAVLRRYHHGQATLPATMNFGRFVLDLRAHEVRVNGVPVPLTAREFALLQLFVEHPRQLFTREQLFQRFWGDIGDRHTVTVHIARIREKIESDPNNPLYIVTVWGGGLSF